MRNAPPSTLQTPPAGSIHPLRLAAKTLGLFILLNLIFAALNPLPALGRISAYNHLFPGRERLPYGENPDQSYNLSLFNLEAMLASHEAAAPKAADEYRVILIGDSSTWGFLLKPEQTLSADLNALGLTAPDGRKMRFYNLGYPTLSLAKDLMILQRSLGFKPDLIIWNVTLESFPMDKQLSSPLVQNNPQEMGALIREYGLGLNPDDVQFVKSGFWQGTLLGQRRPLADLLRLQLYGVMWAATGIDQYYPATYDPPQVDLPADDTFHALKPPVLQASDLSLDLLQAGMQAAGSIPVLLVNEPVFQSNGKNSDIRYNFFYPRWAYDQYRMLLGAVSRAKDWRYLDLWDLLPASQFTNSAIHVTPAGEAEIARNIAEFLPKRVK